MINFKKMLLAALGLIGVTCLAFVLCKDYKSDKVLNFELSRLPHKEVTKVVDLFKKEGKEHGIALDFCRSSC